mgnify:CR=1 FL=1|jgi:hypothetical protein
MNSLTILESLILTLSVFCFLTVCRLNISLLGAYKQQQEEVSASNYSEETS